VLPRKERKEGTEGRREGERKEARKELLYNILLLP
jgi:hypothetical protein